MFCGLFDPVERPSNTATHSSSIHSISIRFDSYLAQKLQSHDLVIYFLSDRFAVAALLHVARIAARYLPDRARRS